MNHARKSCLAVTSVLVLGLIGAAAPQESVPQKPPRGTYTGNVLLEEAQAAMTPLQIRVGYYAPQEELQHYEEVLSHKKVGQEELVDLLHKHQTMGVLLVGSGLGTALSLITWEPTRKGFRLFMAGNRYTLRRDAVGGQNPRDFHFAAIILDIDAKGNGDGALYDGAKLRFNKKHMLEVDDYLGQPARILKVQLDGQ